MGDCPRGSCSLENTQADAAIPLADLSAAAALFDQDACGRRVWLDAGDTWRNEALGGAGFVVDPSCASSDEIAGVLGPYPEDQTIVADWVWREQGGDDALGSATGGTFSTLVDASQSWAVDELVGGYVYITAQTEIFPPVGDSLEIASNTSDTITVIGTFVAPPDLGTDYAVVAPAGVDLFGVLGANTGTVLFYGLEVRRPHSHNVFSCILKNPANTCAFWRVSVRDDLPIDEPALHSIFHLNQPTTDYMVQSGCQEMRRACLNTSGHFFSVANSFVSHPDHDLNSGFLVQVSGHKALGIENVITEKKSGSKVILYSKVGPTVGALASNEWYEIDSSFGSDVSPTGTSIAVRWETRLSSASSSGVLQFFDVSLEGTKQIFQGGFNNTDDIPKAIAWRGGAVDDIGASGLVVFVSDGEEVTWNVRDVEFDVGSAPTPWRPLGIPRSNLADARSDIDAESTSSCTDGCSVGFFGDVETSDLIDITVPAELCMPSWALPSGKTACRFVLNDSGLPVPALSRGGVLALAALLFAAARATVWRGRRARLSPS